MMLKCSRRKCASGGLLAAHIGTCSRNVEQSEKDESDFTINVTGELSRSCTLLLLETTVIEPFLYK
jgi:hypothetical protein